MQEPAVLTGDALVPASPPFRLPDAIVGKERFLSGNGLFHRFFGRAAPCPAWMPPNASAAAVAPNPVPCI